MFSWLNFQTMSFKTFKISMKLIFHLAFISLSLVNFSISAPISPSISYENFMNDIKRDNCSFPSGVILPFKSSDTFEYLSLPLGICKASKEPKHSQEARTLCSEVFNILKNITCHPDKSQNLPEIRVEFTDDVCQNISFLVADPSLKNSSLLKHLTDKFICNIMCADDFKQACKVLLWSHQVQKLIEYLPRVQNVETVKDDMKTTDVIEGDIQPENFKTDSVTKSEKTTLAEKSSSIIQKSDNNPATKIMKVSPVDNEIEDASKINKSNKEISNIKDMNPLLNDESYNKLGDKKHSPSESNVDQPIKVTEDPKLTKDNELIVSKSTGLDEKKADQVITNDKLSIPTQPSHDVNEKEVLINKNNITLDITENKHSSKTISETRKETSSTKKITNIPRNENISEKKVDLGEKVKNSTKIDKADELSLVKNEEGKDNTQPAILPKISNEADEDKAIKQKITQVKEDLDSVLPTVGNNNAETTIADADLERMEEGNGIPEQVEKDQDPYNDMENDGEYSKLDYDDDGFYDSSKTKKLEEVDNRVPKPADISNELPKYEEFPIRNSVGRGSDDIPVMPAFPEQEDSHFFFYFLSLVLILMGGYLLFHNKQKIIALIVEGRHERRRRSHGVGYKKLETK